MNRYSVNEKKIIDKINLSDENLNSYICHSKCMTMK